VAAKPLDRKKGFPPREQQQARVASFKKRKKESQALAQNAKGRGGPRKNPKQLGRGKKVSHWAFPQGGEQENRGGGRETLAVDTMGTMQQDTMELTT